MQPIFNNEALRIAGRCGRVYDCVTTSPFDYTGIRCDLEKLISDTRDLCQQLPPDGNGFRWRDVMVLMHALVTNINDLEVGQSSLEHVKTMARKLSVTAEGIAIQMPPTEDDLPPSLGPWPPLPPPPPGY